MSDDEYPTRAPSLEVLLDDPRWSDAIDEIENLVRDCAIASVAETPALRDGEVALLLTSNARVANFNAEFRGREGATNVLSFPAAPALAPFLGDVALAFETCAREAAEAGRPLRDHAAHLIIHGLLHLIGYDHQTDEDAEVMEALETRSLRRMGAPDPHQQDRAEAGETEPRNA